MFTGGRDDCICILEAGNLSKKGVICRINVQQVVEAQLKINIDSGNQLNKRN